MKLTAIVQNAPVGDDMVSVQLHAQKAKDGTEATLNMSLPITQAGQYVVGKSFRLTITPLK